jgi:hypothetical protein
MKSEAAFANFRRNLRVRKALSAGFLLTYLGVTLTAAGHTDHAHIHSNLFLPDRIIAFFHPKRADSFRFQAPIGSRNAGYYDFCSWNEWKSASLTTEVPEAFVVPDFVGLPETPGGRDFLLLPVSISFHYAIRAPPALLS